MKLSKLLKNVEIESSYNFLDVEVSDITSKSMEVTKNSLFFAYKGKNQDGKDFVQTALERGASVIVTDRRLEINSLQVVVKNIYKAISQISYNFYEIENKTKIIAVVGTNGKTTTASLIYKILNDNGIKAGFIGTTGILYNNHKIAPELTTPDAITLTKHIKEMEKEKVKYTVMELSAHAIAQFRANSLKFKVLAFTNCTQDHLDYFETFLEYEKTKLSVFENGNADFFVVNSDSQSGIKILNSNLNNILSYGIDNPSDIFAINIKNNQNGISYVINLFDEIFNVNLKTFGKFNVYNTMCAITVSKILGLDGEDIIRSVSDFIGVEGRLQFIENYNGAKIFVDYAHTPDGLENTLKSLREITKNKLIVLFGCGGNRDTLKRPIMGEIAGLNADFSIITTDNPRFEEPYKIISQIEKGIRKVTLNYITIQNRYIATGYAIDMLKEGDTLVLCGKGAENYQEVMGIKLNYSDEQTVKDIIAKIDFGGELY